MKSILDLLQSILYFAYHSCVASCYTAAIHGFYDKNDVEESLGLYCEDLEVKESIYLKTLDNMSKNDLL